MALSLIWNQILTARFYDGTFDGNRNGPAATRYLRRLGRRALQAALTCLTKSGSMEAAGSLAVDISKWKLEIYDLLAIILPGLVVIGEGWVLVRGWEAFAATITHLTGSALTVLVLAAFGAGTLV